MASETARTSRVKEGSVASTNIISTYNVYEYTQILLFIWNFIINILVLVIIYLNYHLNHKMGFKGIIWIKGISRIDIPNSFSLRFAKYVHEKLAQDTRVSN